MPHRRLSGRLAAALSGYFLSACVGATQELPAPEDDVAEDDAGSTSDPQVDAGPNAQLITSPDSGASSGGAYATPVVCTSQKTWTGGNRESPLMHPGNACISCHSQGEGPKFALAGTLYPTAHEPNDCNGTSASGASVIVTDANGTDHTLTPNAAGNFYVSGSIAKPYRARIEYQGRTRAMASAQSTGDCNSCHTEAGSQGAPGRLMLP